MSKRPGDPGYAPGWCIHYRYDRTAKRMADSACDAGVRYGDIAGKDDLGIVRRLPCFLNEKQQPAHAEAVSCPKFRAPTQEEIKAHEEWVEKRMGRLRTVMLGIASWREAHKGQSCDEVVECPACGGRLHLSIAAYNGHVHGKCETAGCVSWME